MMFSANFVHKGCFKSCFKNIFTQTTNLCVFKFYMINKQTYLKELTKYLFIKCEIPFHTRERRASTKQATVEENACRR